MRIATVAKVLEKTVYDILDAETPEEEAEAWKWFEYFVNSFGKYVNRMNKL